MPSVNSLYITKNTLGPSESFSLTFVATNEAGSSSTYGSINGFNVEMFASVSGTNYYAMPDLNYIMTSGALIPKGSSRSITLNMQTSSRGDGTTNNLFDRLYNNSLRGSQVSIRITVNTTGASAPAQTFNTINGSSISVINARMNPKIEKLQFKRCTSSNVLDDEGEYVSSTIKTSFSNSSYYSNFKMKFEQCGSLNGMAGSVISTREFNPSDQSDLNTLNSFVTGVTNSNVLIGQLSTFTFSTAYYIRATLYDAYESSIVLISIPSSFVNVHLSAATTGGVALGQFSSATEGSPLFESNYKSRFYDDVTITLGNLRVDSGSTTTKGMLYVSSESELLGNVTCRSGLTASNGTVSAKGLSAGASGVNSSGGLTVSSGNSSVQALTVNGVLTTKSSSTLLSNITVQTAQGNEVIRVNGLATTYNGSVTINAGLSVAVGASIASGLTVTSGGLAVNSGSANFKGGILNIKGGTTAGQSIPYSGNNYKDFTISYTGFTSTPYISCTLRGTENLSKCSIQITALSSTSCTCRVYNTGSANHTVSLNWIAYGLTS